MAPFAVWRGYFLVRCSYRLIGWSEWDDPGAAGRARISVTSVTVRGSNFPQLRTVSAPDRSPFSPTVWRNNPFHPPRCSARKRSSMTMEMDVMHSIQQVKEIHLAIISLTSRREEPDGISWLLLFGLVTDSWSELLKESEAIYTVIARWERSYGADKTQEKRPGPLTPPKDQKLFNFEMNSIWPLNQFRFCKSFTCDVFLGNVKCP